MISVGSARCVGRTLQELIDFHITPILYGCPSQYVYSAYLKCELRVKILESKALALGVFLESKALALGVFFVISFSEGTVVLSPQSFSFGLQNKTNLPQINF